MAKADSNFLKAWLNQARYALDEGSELSYELAETVEELLAQIGFERPDDGDGADVDEMGGPDGDGGQDSGQEPGVRHRSREDSQLDVPGLVRGMDRLPDELLGDGSVPRGTGSGASTTMSPVCKRRPRA